MAPCRKPYLQNVRSEVAKELWCPKTGGREEQNRACSTSFPN